MTSFCHCAAPPVSMTTVTFSGSATSSSSLRSPVAKPPSLSRSLPHRYQYTAQLPSSPEGADSSPQAVRDSAITSASSRALSRFILFILRSPTVVFSWLRTPPR